jgi:nucleotide-binding universal stress UspA family protein
MFEKILVPLDLSSPGNYERALEVAKKQAQAHGARVQLLTVLPAPPPPTFGYQTRYVPKDVLDKVRREAKAAVEKLGEELRPLAKEVDTNIREGVPYHEILQEAEAWGADLIVMQSHRPQMKTYLLGSNAARVVRHAECSVMVIR